MRMRMHMHSTWTYGRGHGHAHVLERLAYHVCEDAADDVQQESGELQRDAGVDYGLGALGDGGADEDACREHADNGREGLNVLDCLGELAVREHAHHDGDQHNLDCGDSDLREKEE